MVEDEDKDRKFDPREALALAHSLLSHTDRDVRNLAIITIALLKDCIPQEILEQVRG